MRLCTVEGCGKKHWALGYCTNHYALLKRHGKPEKREWKREVFAVTGGYLAHIVNGQTVYVHVQVAEKALGRPLPKGAEIHHVNGNPADNQPENIVICPNHEYHMLLHQRERALNACGHADWRPCRICALYDDPASMRPSYKQFYHRACAAEQSRKRRANQRSNHNANATKD